MWPTRYRQKPAEWSSKSITPFIGNNYIDGFNIPFICVALHEHKPKRGWQLSDTRWGTILRHGCWGLHDCARAANGKLRFEVLVSPAHSYIPNFAIFRFSFSSQELSTTCLIVTPAVILTEARNQGFFYLAACFSIVIWHSIRNCLIPCRQQLCAFFPFANDSSNVLAISKVYSFFFYRNITSAE